MGCNCKRSNRGLVEHSLGKANGIGFWIEVIGQRAGDPGQLRVASTVKEHALRNVACAQSGAGWHLGIFAEGALHAAGSNQANDRKHKHSPEHGIIIIKIRHRKAPFKKSIY